MVGDGSYLMMAQELVTAVQEGIKLVVVLVQNHGFASIGALSESLGSQRFGTAYRYRTGADRPARTATCCRSTWPPTPRASAPTCCGCSTIDELRVRARQGHGVRPHDRRARRDRPARSRPRTARPGGTSRSPRCRHWTARKARARDVRPAQAQTSAPYLVERDARRCGPSSTGSAARRRPRDVDAHRAGLEPGHRRSSRPRCCSPTVADVDAAVQAAAKAFDDWSRDVA